MTNAKAEKIPGIFRSYGFNSFVYAFRNQKGVKINV